MQSPTSPHRNHLPLPSATEEALIRVLLNKSETRTFVQICNDQKDSKGNLIFGGPGTDLRRKVQKRRAYLLRRPKSLGFALNEALKSNQSAGESTSSPQSFPSPLATPRPISSIMTSQPSESELPTETLYFDQPWLCPGKIIITRIPNVKVNAKLVDKIRIMYPLADMHDRKHVSGQLSLSGGGIVITDSSTADYLGKSDNVDRISTLTDTRKDTQGRVTGTVCEKTKDVYETVAEAIRDNPEFQTRKVLYSFEGSVTCNNTAFNNDENGNQPRDIYHLNTGFHLDMEDVHVATDANGVVTRLVNLKAFIVWEMVVDTPEDVSKRRRTKTAQKSKTDDLGGAFANLGINLSGN